MRIAASAVSLQWCKRLRLFSLAARRISSLGGGDAGLSDIPSSADA